MNMKEKIHTAKSQTNSLQLGNELVTFTDAKSPIVNLYAEVGMTDWEIHLNQTRHFKASENKHEITEKEFSSKKNTYQNSDYWLG